jgi:Domain of unknown function (DUF4157)
MAHLAGAARREYQELGRAWDDGAGAGPGTPASGLGQSMRPSMMRAMSKPVVARPSLRPQPLPAMPVPAPRGPAASLIALQRSHGNQLVQRLLRRPVVLRACDCGGTCAHCSEEATPQQNPVPRLLQRTSGGRGLEPTVRAFMEHGFGTDFGAVRVHTDSQAAQSAEQLSAAAYTVGQDVFFNRGQYQPQTEGGRRLLAHELTHVVQQQGDMPSPTPSREISEPGDPDERVADRVADTIVAGQPPRELVSRDISAERAPRAAAPKLRIQRAVNDAKVDCRTTGIPSLGISGPDAVAQISGVNTEAILMAGTARSSLAVERLAGPSDPNFATILREELGLDINNAAHRAHMEIVERRFELMSRVLQSDFTGYTCIGAARVTVGACPTGDCCTGTTRACSCPGASHIVLCRPWWTGELAALHQRPGTLIHEAFHIYFGFINDFTTSRLSDAHCYTGFVERLAGVTPFHSCAGRPR